MTTPLIPPISGVLARQAFITSPVISGELGHEFLRVIAIEIV
jgi:hypothetical protein